MDPNVCKKTKDHHIYNNMPTMNISVHQNNFKELVFTDVLPPQRHTGGGCKFKLCSSYREITFRNCPCNCFYKKYSVHMYLV